jgi:hypothetical protein
MRHVVPRGREPVDRMMRHHRRDSTGDGPADRQGGNAMNRKGFFATAAAAFGMGIGKRHARLTGHAAKNR